MRKILFLDIDGVLNDEHFLDDSPEIFHPWNKTFFTDPKKGLTQEDVDAIIKMIGEDHEH